MTARERAAAGAVLLDDKRPGWAKKIDLETFDIGGCTVCALAQVSVRGTYISGVKEIFGMNYSGIQNNSKEIEAREFLADHGFTTHDGLGREAMIFDLVRLNAAWKDAINERLAV